MAMVDRTEDDTATDVAWAIERLRGGFPLSYVTDDGRTILTRLNHDAWSYWCLKQLDVCDPITGKSGNSGLVDWRYIEGFLSTLADLKPATFEEWDAAKVRKKKGKAGL